MTRSAPLAFITGASSGIGQAMALAYLKKGWRVALVARRVEAMTDWVQAIAATVPVKDNHVGLFSANVLDEDSILSAAQACMRQMGLPDVVVANAGISLGVDTAKREDLAVMREVMGTNLLGMAATFQPFIVPMQARGSGTLVGIASVAGIRGLPGHAAYCASKAGVISYCESLRGELQASGLKVVTLAPGYVATPLTRRNRYPMPFLMTAEAFANQALPCIARGTAFRVIPWPMGLVARVLRLLPTALFDRAFKSTPRKHRHTEE